jgi:hypothetical protein
MKIYYMKPTAFRDLIMGSEYTKTNNPSYYQKLIAHDIEETHTHLIDLPDGDLEEAYRYLQGENWSPNGEQKPLILSKGLNHTSMSVGDIIVRNGEYHIVDIEGFTKL